MTNKLPQDYKGNGEVNEYDEEKKNTRKEEVVMRCNPVLLEYNSSIRGVLGYLRSRVCPEKNLIPLGQGDASAFACFRAPLSLEDALVDSTRSCKFNGYAHSYGVPETRSAVAEYVSIGLPYKLSHSDVYLTVGCSQAIHLCLTVLATKGSNILLPRPGFPVYETECGYNGIEIRFYDLIPEKNWEVDLDHVEALADDKTVAMVVINPSNPCGAVFSYEHLSKIAKTAERLKFPIVSDEVYAHMVFGQNKFFPMAIFASVTPVITLGGISKRWLIPGWRFGWIATCDPHGILKKEKVQEGLEMLMNVTPGPPTVIQGAVPSVLRDTSQEFHDEILHLLETAADICYNRIKKIKSLCCYSRPQGSMFIMVKINISTFKDIKDDMEFASTLVNEESVIVLPGSTLGMKNWIRILFAAPSSLLEDAWGRIESFCQRHANTL
uniref:Aminotransferase class I/classII large domain-containing protein n=1 Tax=Araucaria cunninghamii TaxID=56994 RepID=A0A0D6R368_ARACU